MKKYNKKILYILSFIIPIGMMIAISIVQGFSPFGNKTMFIMDMKGQYLEFFASLRYLIKGDSSIFYSWSRSMGGNFIGLFAYYIASPLSFITVLFPLEKMDVAIWVLTVLKIGLCGLSFYTFASYICGKYCVKSVNIKNLLPLALSIAYAFMSYNMVYSMCLMWLDGVILLPIIIMGIEKILDGSKGILYMAAIAALFICNYYTGYMVGIFTAIFFIYRVLSTACKDNIKKYIKYTLIFTADTLLAVGISAPVLLPVVNDLMIGKLSAVTYSSDSVFNFEFAKFIFKFICGRYDSITNSGLPSVYCGILAMICAVLFFCIKNIKIREKIGAIIVIALLICSFYFTKLDIAWHGFKTPMWFPYRYAFVFSFFVLYMACRSAVSFGENVKPENSMKFRVAWISEKIKKAGFTYVFGILIMIISIIDMGINGNAMFRGLDKEFGYGTKEEYTEFVKGNQKLADDIKSSDDGFYRINQNYEYSKNDAMLFGYNGMTHYSSTFNNDINSFIKKFGIAQSYIWNSGYGDTPLLDSLFDVKYILTDRNVPEFYSPKNSTDSGKSSYVNKYCVPVMYSSNVTNINLDIDCDNPFTAQNNLLNSIAGTDEQYFKDINYDEQSVDKGFSYTFTADDNEPVYMYMRTPSLSWADIYVNGEWVGNYFSTETTCNLYLGTFDKGEQVVIECVTDYDVDVSAAYIDKLNTEKLSNTLNVLKNGGIEIKKYGGRNLSGTIDVKKDQTVVTSIPYEKGWTIKVDGKKVEADKFAGAFISMKLSEGKHSIDMSYISPGFKEGMLICIVAVIICLIRAFMLISLKKK